MSPKITNWSRRDRRGPSGSKAAWIHDETEELVYISEKVPNDGYYVMHVAPHEKVFMGRGERLGFSPFLSTVKRIAADKLRDHPEGFGAGDN